MFTFLFVFFFSENCLIIKCAKGKYRDIENLVPTEHCRIRQSCLKQIHVAQTNNCNIGVDYSFSAK